MDGAAPFQVPRHPDGLKFARKPHDSEVTDGTSKEFGLLGSENCADQPNTAS